MSIFSAEIIEIVGLSLQVALLSLVFTLPLATVVAYVLARREFRGWHLVNTISHLPLVMPPVITGYVLLLAFGPNGTIGSILKTVFGFTFAFNWTGAALAAGVMSFPLVMRPIRLAFEMQDREILDTAKTLGANRLSGFLTISLPLAVPGLVAGAVLGFAKALGEFGATITLVSNVPGETQTLSLAVYALLQSPSGDRDAFVLILIGIIISFAAILLSEVITKQITGLRR